MVGRRVNRNLDYSGLRITLRCRERHQSLPQPGTVAAQHDVRSAHQERQPGLGEYRRHRFRSAEDFSADVYRFDAHVQVPAVLQGNDAQVIDELREALDMRQQSLNRS